MTGDLSRHVADAATRERLRAAADRRRAASLAAALEEPADARGRQRALVRLSILLSGGAERSAARRQP
jgi:hypothetical protein